MSAPTSTRARGLTPFGVFGIGLLVAAVWATYMGLGFMSTSNFAEAGLPTIIGTSIAVVAIVIVALRAPPNE